jgi:hypothetical protein
VCKEKHEIQIRISFGGYSPQPLAGQRRRARKVTTGALRALRYRAPQTDASYGAALPPSVPAHTGDVMLFGQGAAMTV